MAKHWQLRTWTKGTGATVEPAGSDDRPPVRARPGGLTMLPPKRQWAPVPQRPAPRAHEEKLSNRSRRRHALGYLDPAMLDRLETLETELDRDDPERD